MIDEEKIIKALDPLPLPLRSIIYSEVKRRYAEVKAAEREEEYLKREVVLSILQGLFVNLIEPLEMIKAILQSRPLAEVSHFKIEFSEITFDKQFIEKQKEFVSSFWSLTRELGFEEEIRPKNKQKQWKSEE